MRNSEFGMRNYFSGNVRWIIRHSVGFGLDRTADYKINVLRSTCGLVKTKPYSVFCISGSALPPAVILSGAGGKIAFSDLVEESPNVWQIRC